MTTAGFATFFHVKNLLMLYQVLFNESWDWGTHVYVTFQIRSPQFNCFIVAQSCVAIVAISRARLLMQFKKEDKQTTLKDHSRNTFQWKKCMVLHCVFGTVFLHCHGGQKKDRHELCTLYSVTKTPPFASSEFSPKLFSFLFTQSEQR